jgi:hypothetical protein
MTVSLASLLDGGPKMFGGKQRSKSRDAPNQQLGKKPPAEDFTGEAVGKAVLKETLEHPATIYPAAGSALAVAWTVMVAASPASVGCAIGCAFVGASAFIYNYVIKGPDRAAAYVAKLRELRRTYSISELEQFALECGHNGLVEGARGAEELKNAYVHLTDYLAAHKDGIAADRFASLAEDTFQEGVNILQQALAIYKAVELADAEVLQKDLARLKRQRANIDDKNPAARGIDLQIESSERRIEIETQQQNELTQLFAQASEIESALQSTYLELIDMQSRIQLGALNEEGGASTRLRSAVDIARRVEQKLRGDSPEDRAKRDKYLQAYEDTGKNTIPNNTVANTISNTSSNNVPLAPNQDQSREEQQ